MFESMICVYHMFVLFLAQATSPTKYLILSCLYVKNIPTAKQGKHRRWLGTRCKSNSISNENNQEDEDDDEDGNQDNKGHNRNSKVQPSIHDTSCSSGFTNF